MHQKTAYFQVTKTYPGMYGIKGINYQKLTSNPFGAECCLGFEHEHENICLPIIKDPINVTETYEKIQRPDRDSNPGPLG